MHAGAQKSFLPFATSKKFWDSKLGTYPAPGQSARQLEPGAVMTLGQWRASFYLQKRPLRSCIEVMGSGLWAPASGGGVFRACRKEPALTSPARVSLQGRPEDSGGCLCPRAWPPLDCFR